MENVAVSAHNPPAAGVSAVVGCAELAAEYDWSESDFGPQEHWAPAVEAVVRTLLEAAVPMAYCHGEGFAMVYNDRLATMLGPKHPHAWGQRVAVVAPESWTRPGLADVFDKVFAGGPSFHDDGEMLGLNVPQPGGAKEAYFVRSYSAVRDSDGSVLGVLIVAIEITSAVRRVEAVSELATALGSAVTVDDVAKAALQHAISSLDCETASVCLGGGEQGGWRVARWRGIEVWDEMAARLPLIWSGFREGARAPEAAVAETGQRFVAEGGGQLILPISGPEVEGSIGYLGMPRDLPDVQMVVLEACAQLVADAMVRARLYEAQRGAAELLQRTLLPQVLPLVPGVTLAARYQPVPTGTAAGGDFYDGFRLPDGRLVVTIGDVIGRGVAAATVMGQVRAGLRGAALTNPDPNAIFTALDELVSSLDLSWPAAAAYGQGSAYAGLAGFGGELFVTALLGVFDPATGELLLASAGHFPPAVVRCRTAASVQADPGRLAEFAKVKPGPPLGITGDRPVLRLVLEEGDALVAFTDGLLERHKRSLTQGQTTLLRTLTTMASTEPRSICQHLIDELIGDEGLEDDCALLALVRDSRVHHMASVLIPPHAGAVRGARRWVRGQLESWNLDEEIVAAAVMGVSELVTNVMLHAGTPARVNLELADRLLVTVEDTGVRGAPHRDTSNDRSASQGRGLALVEAISDDMGHSRGVGGSTVWFEIVLDSVGHSTP